MSIKRIIISESDRTTNGLSFAGTDIVYIPGFAYLTDANVKPRVPTLCSTVTEFTKNFGTSAPTFMLDQYYKKAEVSKDGTPKNGFLEDAIPEQQAAGDTLWFSAGSSDPSWEYAYDLVSSGIPVVYERINNADSKLEGVNAFKSIGIVYEEGDIVIGATLDTEGKEIRKDFYKCIAQVGPGTAEEEIELDSTHWAKLEEDDVYDVTVDKMYRCLCGDKKEEDDEEFYGVFSEDDINLLMDKGSQQAKYITTGGYPNFEYLSQNGDHLAQLMSMFAGKRGDCVAFIDHTNKPERTLIGSKSVYESVKGNNKITGQSETGTDIESHKVSTASFATMITPWFECTTASGTLKQRPGSFGYFMALLNNISADSVKWSPIAGPSRGRINNITRLLTNKRLTNTIADSYQSELDVIEDNSTSINAITEIQPYGYCLYGNRTLVNRTPEDKGFATTFLNIRNLVSDVKKRVYLASKTYMFEQNTDILWINFKSQITPLLDQMVANSALSNYKIVQLETSDQTKIACRIYLYTRYAVESFDVNIVLANSDDEEF